MDGNLSILPLVSQGSSTYAKFFPLPDFWGKWYIFSPQKTHWIFIPGLKSSLIPTLSPASALAFLSSKNIPMQCLKAAILILIHHNSHIDTKKGVRYPWILSQFITLISEDLTNYGPYPNLYLSLNFNLFLSLTHYLAPIYHFPCPLFHEGMNFCFSPWIYWCVFLMYVSYSVSVAAAVECHHSRRKRRSQCVFLLVPVLVLSSLRAPPYFPWRLITGFFWATFNTYPTHPGPFSTQPVTNYVFFP